jgi:hypothetical protein
MDELGRTKTGRKRSKPTMVHVNVRLPKDVFEFYKAHPNYTKVMREVLVAHAQKQP